MLKGLVEKYSKDIAATDLDGITKYFKVLNSQYVGVRRLYTDQQGVATIDSEIVPGDILTIPTGEKLLVSMITTDYYRSEAIRLTLDLIETNNTVTVTRQEIQKTAQGGVAGTLDTEIHTSIPVKIGRHSISRDKDNDIMYTQFGMLLTSKCPVKIGDSLTFGSFYEQAKVEGIQFNHEGMFEITFDKDPTWS